MNNNRLELTDGCIHSRHREIVGFIDSLKDKEYIMLEAYLEETKEKPREIVCFITHSLDPSPPKSSYSLKEIMMEELKYIRHNYYLPLKYVIKTISKEEYVELNPHLPPRYPTCPECEADRKSMGFFQTIKRLLKGE